MSLQDDAQASVDAANTVLADVTAGAVDPNDAVVTAVVAVLVDAGLVTVVAPVVPELPADASAESANEDASDVAPDA